MSDHQAQCEAALLDGQWDLAESEARAWARHLPAGVEKDPRPHFVLNVVHLVRGQFADAWQTVCNAEKIAKIIRELKSRGWTKMDRLLVFSSGDAPELYASGGGDINGVQIYNYINPNLDTPRWNAFREAYMKAHSGNQPPSLSTNYYDALYMIKRSIDCTAVTGDPKKLKEERKMIAEHKANMKDFHRIMFNWDMTNGVPTNKPTFIFSIKDGKKKLVREVKPKGASLREGGNNG